MADDAFDRAAKLFLRARAVAASERAALLERACAGDDALRRAVEELLAGEDRPLPFAGLAAEVKELPGRALAEVAPDGAPGSDRVGPFKLLEQIGEGGFGTVYMAEQQEPVQRKVALKILKPGMDTRQVIARFEAERQALALMDHPNITRVLDAGATANGRPYFAMDLVRGVPITQYCDTNRLTTAQRLLLFIPVCQAVQHAHQKGIIHRDLKPSNVLVTLHDGVPVPKVIDFGIAKATHGRLTDLTLFTEFHQFIGTPEYMSPEQAEMSGLDVDTRTDVYALGVLLYELLTGSTPLHQTLRGASPAEYQRIIREVEPATPSRHVSTMFARGRSPAPERDLDVGRQRRTLTRDLARELRGDLDWIVMKCLEKDRTRRYQTADALVEDIRRFQADDAVSASPPSAAYRLRKFARRHRGLLLGAAAVIVALAAGLAAAALAWREAKRQSMANMASMLQAEKEVAKQKAVVSLLCEVFTSANPERVGGVNLTVRQLLDDFSASYMGQLMGDPEVEAELLATLGVAYLRLGEGARARPNLERALELRRRVLGPDHPQVADSLAHLGQLLDQTGQSERAEALHREALALRERLPGDHRAEVAASLRDLAYAKLHAGAADEAQALCERSLGLARDALGDGAPDVAEAHQLLAAIARAHGELDRAESELRAALATFRRAYGEAHPRIASCLNHLGAVLTTKAELAEAEQLQREALAMEQEIYGESHALVAFSLSNLASVLARRGDFAGAEDLARKSLAMQEALFGRDHPLTAQAAGNLGKFLLDRARYPEADALFDRALAVWRNATDRRPDVLAATLNNQAIGKMARGDDAGAETLLEEAVRLRREYYGERDPGLSEFLQNLGECRRRLADLGGAEEAMREALESARKWLGPRHPQTGRSTRLLASVLLQRGDADLAGALALDAVGIAREAEPAENRERIEALELLASARLAGGLAAEAEAALTEALPISRRVNGVEHWLTAWLDLMLGEALVAEGRLEEAEPHVLAGFRAYLAAVPAPALRRERAERTVRALYDQWGRPERAAEVLATSGL